MNCLKCHLQIEPSEVVHYGLHPECFTEWFKLSSVAEFISLQRRAGSSSEPAASLSPQNNSFFHGKFKKYSANLNDNSYILKMRENEAPELPEVEYLCNQIAQSLSVPVAKFYFIDFYGDRTFVTRNFIKHGTVSDLQHIYHFRPGDQHTCEGIINVIIKETKRPYDVRTFIKTVLFDALIGNHDRHGRNLAFIRTAKSTMLSPIYDNVSFLSLEKGIMLAADFNPAGKIGTSQTNEPGMLDYIKELKRLRYGDDIDQFYKKINLPQLFQLIDKSFCSTPMKGAIKTLVNKRFEELKNGLLN